MRHAYARRDLRYAKRNHRSSCQTVRHVAIRRGSSDGSSHKRSRFDLSDGRCDRLESQHRVVNSRGTGRCTVTCMVTLASEVHRCSVCMTKTRNALRRVKTSTGTTSRMRGGSRACVTQLRLANVAYSVDGAATLGGRRHSAGERIRQRARGPQIFHSMISAAGIPCACRGRTACIYLWGRIVGELLRDR